MPKEPPPLLGFNNNVRHQGRVFHIQTEDSGVKRPRIVTHLFADGGRILKTTRTDYAEHVGREDMVAVVKRLMKEQHKGMFIALRAGELDELIQEACGPVAVAPEAAEALDDTDLVLSKPPPKPRRSKPPEQTAAEAPPPSQVGLAAPTPAQIEVAAEVAAAPRKGGRSRSLSNPGLRRVMPSVPPPPAGSLDDLDVASLDLPPAAADSSPIAAEAPPSAGERDPHESGTHQTARVAKHPPPPPRRGTPVQGTPARANASPPPTGKYAPSRPAAIFAEAPSPEKRSIFGESLISEKSLDEVILSYLAEDLETSSGE